VGGCWVVG